MIKSLPASKRSLSLCLLVLISAVSVLPAHARMYDVLNAEVPFDFQIGSRTFHRGHYDWVLAGPGLIALRDSHKRVVASVVVRSVETSSPARTTKLVFSLEKNHERLSEIWIANRREMLQVVGEELAIRRPAPDFAPVDLSWDINSLFERPTMPAMRR